MSERIRLFLAHSFDRVRRNAEHKEELGGISDFELADIIAETVRDCSGGAIEVVRACDPYHNYISSQVRSDICSADLMICLFTKRTLDQVTGEWISSTYVISEASAGLMQFPSESQTHVRLLGLVEDGVDRRQLGMAFHQNRTTPGFRRDKLEGLRTAVRTFVRTVIDQGVVRRSDREYVSLDKTVTIFRNGAVMVECRHRFRFTSTVKRVVIPHAIWRVSDALPPFQRLDNLGRNVKPGYLRCVPVNCGGPGQKTCSYRILPKRPSAPNEHPFDVEFSNLDIHAGDELTYDIAWGYANAFRNPAKPGDPPNSVGLRTGERGMAHSASLTLQFERDPLEDTEPYPILDEPPVVWTIDAPLFPRDVVEFWHGSPAWQMRNVLQPCGRRTSAMWEVYRWATECFVGTAKVTWIPKFNYLRTDEEGTPGKPVEGVEGSVNTPPAA